MNIHIRKGLEELQELKKNPTPEYLETHEFAKKSINDWKDKKSMKKQKRLAFIIGLFIGLLATFIVHYYDRQTIITLTVERDSLKKFQNDIISSYNYSKETHGAAASSIETR